MKKSLLPLPEGFATYASAILNKNHARLPMDSAMIDDERFSRMRHKGFTFRYADKTRKSMRNAFTLPRR